MNAADLLIADHENCCTYRSAKKTTCRAAYALTWLESVWL